MPSGQFDQIERFIVLKVSEGQKVWYLNLLKHCKLLSYIYIGLFLLVAISFIGE